MVPGVTRLQTGLIRVVFRNAGLHHRGNDIPAQTLPSVLGVLHAVLRVDPDQNIVQAQAFSLRLVPGLGRAYLHKGE